MLHDKTDMERICHRCVRNLWRIRANSSHAVNNSHEFFTRDTRVRKYGSTLLCSKWKVNQDSKGKISCPLYHRSSTVLLLWPTLGQGHALIAAGAGIGWLCWGLTSQSTIFQSYRDGAIASWVINQYFRGVKCLAQGHNMAAVGFEPRTSRSGGAGMVGCYIYIYIFFFSSRLYILSSFSNASSVGRLLDILKYCGLGGYNPAVVVSYYRRRAR